LDTVEKPATRWAEAVLKSGTKGKQEAVTGDQERRQVRSAIVGKEKRVKLKL
jgi:hypothetical protein